MNERCSHFMGYKDFNVKIGQSVKFLYKRKIVPGIVHKIGNNCIDVKANGKYFFCMNYDHLKDLFTDVIQTKNYNTK